MHTAEILRQAHESGLHIRADGGKLLVKPAERLTGDMHALLKAYKADLIRWFTQTQTSEPEPPMDPVDWRELHGAYIAHHWMCRTCCAAGQGRGLRCGAGAALWGGYLAHDGTVESRNAGRGDGQ